ncbi:MAG TPA: hypothetical protein VD838_21100, partial [Anaeromyxobacteraceae bacterium]|nr:hypothetical protein [Anaeromyxobacteraceae bacterium]
EIVTTINDSDPTGRTYRIPGTGATYRASAPGEPPAIREGLYVSSWHGTPAVELGNAVMAAAFTNRRVGAHSLGELLEYGTKRGLAPRPHVRPAMTKAKPKVKRILRTG